MSPTKRPALIVFLTGLLVALLWTFVVFPHFSAIHQWFDLNGYGELAEHIVRGDGYTYGYGPSIRRPPLYPYLLAGVLGLFGFDPGHREASYTPVLVLQCLFAGLTCVFAYLTARRVFGARAAMAAGLLCAVWPQCLRYVGAVDVEATLTLLTAALTYATVLCYQEPIARRGLLVGALVGLSSLAKPIAMLFPLAVLALLAARRQVAARRRVEAAGAMALALVVVCAPWIVRNHVVTQGRFHAISSNASGEFLRGYVNARPEFWLLRRPFQGNWDVDANVYEDGLLRRNGATFFVDVAGAQVPPLKQSVDDLLRKESIENRVALRMALGDPVGLLRKTAIQLATYWYVVETPGKSLVVGAFALVAMVLAGVGALTGRRAGAPVAPVLATVLYFNAVYALTLAFARYSMPVYPALLVLSSGGLMALVGRRTEGAETAGARTPAAVP